MLRRFIPLLLLASLVLSSVAIAQERPASGTRFTRDAALLKATQEQILAAVRRRSPVAAAMLQQLFSRDLIATLGPAMRRMGLDHEDLADMTALYWIAAWEASHGIVGKDTDPRLARGARDQIAGVFGANPAVARMSDRERQSVADTMLLRAILVELRMRAAANAGPKAQKRMSDTIHAEARKQLRADLRTLKLTAGGLVPAAGAPVGADDAPVAPAPQAPDAGAAAAPAPHPENWAQVEGVYFRSYANFGVGGMVMIDYEPLVLFRDGTYYEVEGPALEEVDLAASRGAKPKRWGRWARSGDRFTLTNAKGKSSQKELQGGSFFKAFPAKAAGNRLAATYSRVSGGGNSALGGGMTIAAQTSLAFTADGRYMRASSAGAIGSGDTTGIATSASSRKRRGVGRYRIERYTITLTEPDGSTRREFFAFGSRKSPPQPDTKMIFLGDRVYVVWSK